ncbi:hypothetical protein, conserved [Plasmodium vivax]|nr:hypothetical protein, conserved [Plasmodium vivax]
MAIPDTKPRYVAYSNYDEIIQQYKKYENLKEDNESKEDFNKNIENINTKRKNLNVSDNIFIKLHKILRNSHVFFEGKIIDNYCIYVNYLLNKEVRDLFPLVNESNFHIFHTFAKNFNDNKYGSNNDNACLKYIKYQKYDVSNKMEILIYLYDRYNVLKSYKGSEHPDFCSLLSLMGKLYTSAVDNHKDDENFFNKLKEFKLSIEQNEWASNRQCPVKNYIKLPEPEPSKPSEDPDTSKQARALSQESESHGSSRGQNTLRLEDVSEKKATQDLLKPPETVDVSEPSEFLESNGEQETRHLPGSKYSLRRSISGLPENSPHYELFKTQERSAMTSNEQTHISSGYGKADTDVMMGAVQDRITEVDPNTQTIPKDGLLNKMQYFFSETIGQVEPAPILGVSGGMGALFLLFRYTPVGTFFGGRRGRNHRIPSGFPGAYPGFSEYYDGNLGNMPINVSYQP